MVGLLKWKIEIKTYDRSGRFDSTSWRMVRKARPGHEEILLDRTTQSVRNEETLRDRSDDLMIPMLKKRQDLNNSSVETMKQIWLSVESRSFVNRMNDEVRKRQKNSNVTEN